MIAGVPSPVLHVNDCAGVARTLVDTAASRGLDWRLFLPAARRTSAILTAKARTGELLTFQRHVGDAELLHVHFGLMSYYAARAKRPFVLHLHGSDINRDLHVPLRRSIIRWGLRHASAVVYATPDLAEPVDALRPDATWLPGPVTPAALERSLTSPEQPGEHARVVFCSRWEPVKGAEEQLEAVADLRRALPKAEIIALDWGPLARDAAVAGARLVPPVSRAGFLDLLGSATVVVGQMRSGTLGMSELEALALGVPVAVRLTWWKQYDEQPPVENCEGEQILDVVMGALQGGAQHQAARVSRREWVIKHHGPDRALMRLCDVYGAAR